MGGCVCDMSDRDAEVRGDLDRASGGEFVAKYDADEFLRALVERHPEPLTAGEVGEIVGAPRTTARNRLEQLVDADLVATKKAGARARVYWTDEAAVATA